MTFLWTEKARAACAAGGIAESDAERLIRSREAERCSVLGEGTGHRFCHAVQGFITLWAEYILQEETCIVQNVYYHRVGIEEEIGK